MSDSTASAVRRIGVYGGAFDPPHRAHEALARAALEQLALDELRLLPTGAPWHRATAVSPAAHRLAMVQAAFGDWPGVVIDTREIDRAASGQPTYTVDTLQALATEQPGAELWLLMGEDQYRSLPAWHQAARVRELARLAVARRDAPGWAESTGAAASQGGDTDTDTVRRPPERWLNLPLMPDSATAVRHRVADGQGADRMVAPAVARYIAEHQLYRRP